MLLILFRSKLTAEAGADYGAMSDELHSLVHDNPGFVDVKHYTAADGERLTVVWFKDEESLRAWRQLPRHREAQTTGRMKWYEYYKMEVATVDRVSEFTRTPKNSDNSKVEESGQLV
jgi:heme-degrading monooxygenase HmoA